MMKTFIVPLLGCMAFFPIAVKAQTNTFPTTGSVGVGTLTPVASAQLEMQSTSQGFLAPRMTKAQRDAIAAPATGLLIYQTNSSPGFYYWNGSSWTSVVSKGANTSLSNLAATTNINSALLPNADNTLDLGSGTRHWNEVYVNSIKFMDGSTQSTAGGAGATYTAGTGISIAGTVISNTGDTNSGDDVITSTLFSGDVSGIFSNLQLGADVVSGAEIADGSVSSSDIGNGTIAAADLSNMGATSGQVMQWNGSAWIPTTVGGGAETDPQVNVTTTSLVPRWDGTALVNGAIYDDGDKISVGWNNGILTSTTAAFYNQENPFSTEDIALKAVDQTVIGETATTYAYANLGYNTSGLLFGEAPVSHVGVWGYAGSAENSAAIYANNTGTAAMDYGLVAKSTGSGTTNIGLYVKSTGATNNYAMVVPNAGGRVGIGTEAPNLTLHVNAPAGEDAFRVQTFGSTKLMVHSNGGVSVGSLSVPAANGLYVSGDVQIGAASPATGYKVSVDGKIMCEELKVQLSPWPDYVFQGDYPLLSLGEVEAFIQTNGHLPAVPSAAVIESEGLEVGQMQAILMEKIEELTLYMIALDKENAELKSRIALLEQK